MTLKSDNPLGAPHQERRQSARYLVVDFVWFTVIEENIDESHLLEGLSRMCDISKGGIGIYVTEKLPLHKLVFLELAANKIRISAIGRIVNQRETEDGQYRVGIQFKIVPPNDRLTLARLWKKDDKG